MAYFKFNMRLGWLFVTILAVVSAVTINASSIAEEQVRYDGYKVFKLYINNKAQLSVINRMKDLTHKLHIWKNYDELSKELVIMVHPVKLKYFRNTLHQYGFKYEVTIENVQRLIDEEQADTRGTESFGWTRYHNLEQIETWLDGILETYPDVTEGFEVGKSYENRTIRGIKISHKVGNPGIFIESNIHAREWITSATATWFINQLLTSNEPEVRNLADNYDWYIVPVLNVDGFAYSHKTDRMWRKTRQPHSTSPCIGVDPNRNFDFHWDQSIGSSDDPCSLNFHGSAPFSEPEARALVSYVRSVRDKLNMYISFHSFGQWLLIPYAHAKNAYPENYADLLAIGTAYTAAVKSLPYGTEVVAGATGTLINEATGSSPDWMFEELNFNLTFTMEFRDKGRWGMLLPPAQILPNCEELLAGMIALVARAKDLKYI